MASRVSHPRPSSPAASRGQRRTARAVCMAARDWHGGTTCGTCEEQGVRERTTPDEERGGNGPRGWPEASPTARSTGPRPSPAGTTPSPRASTPSPMNRRKRERSSSSPSPESPPRRRAERAHFPVDVVELGGFEPPTFSLRTRRATNCAIAPRTGTSIAPPPTEREPGWPLPVLPSPASDGAGTVTARTGRRPHHRQDRQAPHRPRGGPGPP